MRKLRLVAVCSMVGLASACGESGPAVVDALVSPPLDSAPDAAVDAFVPDPALAPLVGDWKTGAEVDPSIGMGMISFHADGTCSFDTKPCRFGVPAPGRLTLINGADSSETDFMIDGNRLLITAFLPQGTPIGFVGTWTNIYVQNGVAGSFSISVRSDDTATFTVVGSTGQSEIVGTITSESTGFAFSASGQVLFHFRPLGANKALGYLLFDKQ
ncbi:MAG TPA: hypothetical protein PLF40_09015 [Kofleriaceae bacterium]|nr:hypothetical protein [Kofleriaceae bacterium]